MTTATKVANANRVTAATRFTATASVASSTRSQYEYGGFHATSTCSCGYVARAYYFGGDVDEARATAEANATADMTAHLNRWHRALGVGDGVTRLFPQDCYGYVVVDVSPNGKVATLVSMPTDPAALGGKPADFTGPFPVWSTTYTREQLAEQVAVFRARVVVAKHFDGQPPTVTRLSLRKDGKWRPVGANYVGSEFATDRATYHRDYSW